MSEQSTINIEVDGKSLEATPGQMLIEVTDEAGITVPRFCYHKNLTVAASCRMCLVEVENAPKPLPACATPVMEGMKVFTRSPLAREAQKGTMEFLLINHPLDCPICDQGGECELQDVAMGFGGDVSRYSEGKRIIKDEDIGSLIATDMTRCIHCTRCVRFGTEIAGMREMGATGRGEHMRIGLFVEKSVESELSGNIIDLCPVGALTSKPFRFTARAWEMTQTDTIAPHDCVGSNVHVHIRRDQVMRMVPKENEDVNETWISDRDRYSYQGLTSKDRLAKPMIRKNGQLKEVDWQDALQAASKLMKGTDAAKMGALVSPNATLEEMYLTQKLMSGLGSNNIDHRLFQNDFSADAADPSLPWLGQSISDLEHNDATLLLGSWLRKEQPLLNTRVRESIRNGGQIMAINPVNVEFNYDLVTEINPTPADMLSTLAGVAAALGVDTAGVNATSSDDATSIANTLKDANKATIIMGAFSEMHPDFGLLRQLATNIATATNATLGLISQGGNSTGAWLAGVVPHRGPAGSALENPGVNPLSSDMDTCLMVNIEPEFDSANPALMAKLMSSAKTIAVTTHLTDWLKEKAEIVLPSGAFTETSGTYVNCQNDKQSFSGVVSPLGEARPGWKVLRVLGNLLDLDGFDYVSSEEVKDELLEMSADLQGDNSLKESQSTAAKMNNMDIQRIGGIPMYSSDAIVRRAIALQQTVDAWTPGIHVSSEQATRFGLGEGDSASITQGDATLTLPVICDDRIPYGCVWMPVGVPGSELLGAAYGNLKLEKA